MRNNWCNRVISKTIKRYKIKARLGVQLLNLQNVMKCMKLKKKSLKEKNL